MIEVHSEPDNSIRTLRVICSEDEIHPNKTVYFKKRIWWTGNRENVLWRGIYLFADSTERTMAHEFGHALGLYDEYDSRAKRPWETPALQRFIGYLEQLMPWKDNRYNSDSAAMMHSGSELRLRYFQQIFEAIKNIERFSLTLKNTGA